MTFAGVTTRYAKNTIKLSVEISSWPFLNLQNSLHVNMNSGVAGAVSCTKKNTDSSNSLRWFMVVVNDTSLYGQFLDKAEIDTKIRNISFVLKDEQTIAAVLPHFWEYASLDPQFSLLLKDPSANCGKKFNWKLIEILVPTLVGAAILCGLIVFLYPRIKTCIKVRKMKKVDSSSSTELDTQNRQL
eukprot:Phypoly_transcript_05819.p1 GENE.Phypoly_transcript_05819~~Phypoly_transcript_05819.p1  ORF type:complete len:186 (+),score=18.62 Phypoly_transcript_05819:1180-1737(+)